MERTLPKYAPSILPVDYPVYWTFKIALSSIDFEWRKSDLVFLVSEFRLHRDLSVTLFIKRYEAWLPTSVNSISIQCMVD